MTFWAALRSYLPKAVGDAVRSAFGLYGIAATLAGILAALGLQVFSGVPFTLTLVVLAFFYILAHMLFVGPTRLHAKVATSVPRIVVVRAFAECRPQFLRPASWSPLLATAPPGSVPMIAPMPVSSLLPELSISSNSATSAAPTGTRSSIVEKPFFALVEFRNDSQSASANDMAAHVSFLAMDGDKPLIEMEGRWTEPEEADRRTATLGPNGLSATLDIALKRTQDDDCYAYNTESRRRSPTVWRVPERKLSPGGYRVKVQLRAAGYAGEFWFRLDNPGSGQDLAFSLAPR